MIARVLAALAVELKDGAPALANHLWQSTVFAGMAAALAFALKKNQARTRCWVWMAASMKFLLPLSLLVGAASYWAKPRIAVTPMNPQMYAAVEDVSEPFEQPLASPQAHVSETRHGVSEVVAIVVPLVCGTAWLAGFVTVIVSWSLRWAGVEKTMRAATEMREGREVAALRRMESAVGVRLPVALRVCAGAMEPGVFGILRPALAWPAAISERLDEAQLEAVLAHEVCHVRRRDNLAAALHMLVEAAFWFHPLVWWMGALLVAERERACDEAVLAVCGRPVAYAESILKVCEFCVESPLECVAGVTGANLKQRVVEIMTARTVRKLTPGKKLLIGAVGACVLAVPFVLGQAQAAQQMMAMVMAPPQKLLPAFLKAPAAAQAEDTPDAAVPAAQQQVDTADAATRAAFDVASIRPSVPSPYMMRWQPTPDGLIVQTMALKTLISYAYGIQQEYVVGGADWTSSQQYDINAKFGDKEAANFATLSPPQRDERLKAMLRTLLVERFKLKVRRETKEVPTYALVVAKSGPKLAQSPPLVADQDGVVPPEGSRSTSMFDGRQILKRTNMRDFAAQLGRDPEIAREVVDETGLQGRYDFEYKWKSTPDDSGPSLFTVLEEQLGLKLVPRKGAVETLVIESAEKPSVDGAEVPAQATQAVPPAPATPSTADANAGYVPTMTFDVASVRENKEADLRRGITMSGQFAPHTTNLRLINWRIESILSAAYGVDEWQVAGAPKWPFPTVFVVEAKGDSDADAKMAALPVDEQRMEQQHMLQALLADRFKLKTHWETKEGDVYNLVVAKGGPKLGAEGSMPPSAEELKNFGDRPVLPLYQKNDGRGYDFVGHACPMNYLVDMLTNQFGRPVIDKTGLTGKYDFVVKYKDRWDRDRSADDMDPTPPLDRALTEELGLKVESAKGPVKVLVIDHIEKPSEN